MVNGKQTPFRRLLRGLGNRDAACRSRRTFEQFTKRSHRWRSALVSAETLAGTSGKHPRARQQAASGGPVHGPTVPPRGGPPAGAWPALGARGGCGPSDVGFDLAADVGQHAVVDALDDRIRPQVPVHLRMDVERRWLCAVISLAADQVFAAALGQRLITRIMM